jgi:hypothetical protein
MIDAAPASVHGHSQGKPRASPARGIKRLFSLISPPRRSGPRAEPAGAHLPAGQKLPELPDPCGLAGRVSNFSWKNAEDAPALDRLPESAREKADVLEFCPHPVVLQLYFREMR